MNNKREHFARYVSIGVLFVLLVLVFIGRLININVTGQGYIAETSHTTEKTRVVKVQAIRGEIYDRNGKPLITNEYSYDIQLEAGGFSGTNTAKNQTVLKIYEKTAEYGESEKLTQIKSPFLIILNASGTENNYEYSPEYMNTVYGKRLEKMLLEIIEKEELPVAEEGYNLLLKRYGLLKLKEDSKTEYDLLYSEEETKILLDLRLDLELHNFSVDEPYTLLTDVSMGLMTCLKEEALRGVQISTVTERVYNYPGAASHILGRTGKIQESKADYYTELGYSLNETVGISGAEEAFEQYLHGEDGEITIVEDEYGNVIDQYVSKESVPGKNVYLTIDIDLQIDAEKALKNNVEKIVADAAAKEKEEDEHVGEDADAAAMSMLDIETGEVLAIASYPTYDLSTFDEDYKTLNEDPLSPMFNRALEGTYAPGSTFKPGVAAAALEEGIITSGTELPCDGKYTYYESSGFTPACWIYNMYRSSHGLIAVKKAIEVSCNCFFYEVGRRMTISTMNKYCKGYGLGEPTGIELNEKTGVLAGPEYREENGLEDWTPGQTITAAIGQSDNLFTPLQLCVYNATLINGGTRYKAHILYEVHDFYTDELVYKQEAEEAEGDKITLSESVVSTVLGGMKNVLENGSAASVFSNYPITVGGKTGTAQVFKTQSDNAVFTAFAPFEAPKVTAACVIEKGASGSAAGYAIRDTFTKYFGLEYPTMESEKTAAETEAADAEN